MSNIIDKSNKDIMNIIKDQICKGASDNELLLFIHNCNKAGLDPMQKQCWAVKRWDSSLGKEVFAFQTGVDGFRVIANRSDKYCGQVGHFWCGDDGKWVDVWLSNKPPLASKVGVLRSDFKEPLWAVARFSSYAAKKKDGSLTPFWVKMPDLMIAKVAECLALRKAFPQDLSGIYSDTEMEQAEQIKDVRQLKETNKEVKLNPAIIKPEEIAHCAVEKEQSHIVHTKEKSNPQYPQVNPQKKEPERFPKKEDLTISKEQADFLKTTGHKFGYKTNEISKVIFDITGKESWGWVTNVEFELILQHIIDNRKGL